MQTGRGEYFIKRDFSFYDSGLCVCLHPTQFLTYEYIRRWVWRSVESGDSASRKRFSANILAATVTQTEIGRGVALERNSVNEYIAKMKKLGWLRVIPGKDTKSPSTYVLGERIRDSAGMYHEVFYADAWMAGLVERLEATAQAKTQKGRILDLAWEDRIALVKAYIKETQDTNGDGSGADPNFDLNGDPDSGPSTPRKSLSPSPGYRGTTLQYSNGKGREVFDAELLLVPLAGRPHLEESDVSCGSHAVSPAEDTNVHVRPPAGAIERAKHPSDASKHTETSRNRTGVSAKSAALEARNEPQPASRARSHWDKPSKKDSPVSKGWGREVRGRVGEDGEGVSYSLNKGKEIAKGKSVDTEKGSSGQGELLLTGNTQAEGTRPVDDAVVQAEALERQQRLQAVILAKTTDPRTSAWKEKAKKSRDGEVVKAKDHEKAVKRARKTMAGTSGAIPTQRGLKFLGAVWEQVMQSYGSSVLLAKDYAMFKQLLTAYKEPTRLEKAIRYLGLNWARLRERIVKGKGSVSPTVQFLHRFHSVIVPEGEMFDKISLVKAEWDAWAKSGSDSYAPEELLARYVAILPQLKLMGLD